MKIHFIGIGGIGMSALAQLHAMAGDAVTGSDRLINKGMTNLPVFNALRALGAVIFPQDGSAIDKDTELVIVSSAIESDNVDLVKAKELGILVMHRAALLAKHVEKSKTIAISGTSGKSTTTAMLYEILVAADLSPSVITGATLFSLQEKGFYGNVYKGASDILVIEADESDGSLVNYHPEIGVCLNIQKDHKELDILNGFFKTFAAQCKTFFYNGDQPELKELFSHGKTFGLEAGDVHATDIVMDGRGSRFFVNGQKFSLNIPGEHNIKNALVAIAIALEMGVSLEVCAKALSEYKGIYRRFNIIGKHNEVEVIDDFAHNPHKLEATLKAAHLRGKRVIAFFQPHAFASVKLLHKEFVEVLYNTLNENDKFYLTEAYYPGGTIPAEISAEVIEQELKAKGLKNVIYNSCREILAQNIVGDARPGDVILVMGARDPSLTNFAKSILEGVKEKRDQGSCGNCILGNCCLNFHMK
ncbi:UDP-N-acetylmuramate--alanine ligase [Elusimicrobium posterum]|uniref:UDP-N-acetylmuramate--L-alanine ligase n=1 Tax=Elusimicrobium posterum TaxID=3116653 RepID=UPI003C7452F3